MKNTYNVSGIHCASCVRTIEKTISNIPGVTACNVNFATEKVQVESHDHHIDAEKINEKLSPYGYEITPEQGHHHQFSGSSQDHSQHISTSEQYDRKVSSIMTIIVFFFMGREIFGANNLMTPMPEYIKEFFHHLFPILATYTLLVIGRRYLNAVGIYIQNGFRGATMDTLIGIGSSVGFLYSFIVTAFDKTLEKYMDVSFNFYEAVIVVICFVSIGKFIEHISNKKTTAALTKLIELQSKEATLIRDGQEITVSINNINKGDIVIVKPGQKIPVDGKIISGEAEIDESMITGEFMPIYKHTQSNVVAGTINKNGILHIEATTLGENSFLANIIKLVNEAQHTKPRIQQIVDEISERFVPLTILVAIIALITRSIIGRQTGNNDFFIKGIISFVSVLVISCPCGLGLATPLALVSAIGKGASNGILLKNPNVLEILSKTSTIVFDKTGTITYGKPTFHAEKKFLVKKNLTLLCSLENNSTHPIADAVISYSKNNNIPLMEVKNFVEIAGKGSSGFINSHKYFVGNNGYVKEILGDKWEQKNEDEKTTFFLFDEEKVLGEYSVIDEIKESSQIAIKELYHLGIQTHLLTGDNQTVAQKVADNLGIQHIHANTKPAQKATYIQQLKQTNPKDIVVMVGDGINDAPALSRADVGVAMSNGTDIAIESADLILLGGDITKILKAIKLSQSTQSTIWQNLGRAFSYNIIGIPLAAGLFYPLFGVLLNPTFAGVAMAFSSLIVVLNTLRRHNQKI